MLINITEIKFRQHYLFDTLTVFIQDHKILTTKFHSFRCDGEYRFIRPNIFYEFNKITGQKISLQVQSSILNLVTEPTRKQIRLEKCTNSLQRIQTELAKFDITYSINKQELLPETTIEQTEHSHKSVFIKRFDAPYSQKRAPITQFNVLEDKECQVCQSKLGYKDKNHVDIQNLQKQMAYLRQELQLEKKKRFEESKKLSEQLDIIEEKSTAIIIENLQRKRNEMLLRNKWENERTGFMQKILHLRQLLNKVQNIQI